VNASVKLVIALMLCVSLASGCAPTSVDEATLVKVVDGRLAVSGTWLTLDGQALAELVTDYEPGPISPWGSSLALRSGGTLYWLRYEVTHAIPAPYTPKVSVALVLDRIDVKRLPVDEAFVLRQAWDADQAVWLAGHHNAGRLNYWELLYLYNPRAGQLILVNSLVKRNSVVIDRAYSKYVDVTARHLEDQPSFGDAATVDSAPVSYRIYNDGRVEARTP